MPYFIIFQITETNFKRLIADKYHYVRQDQRTNQHVDKSNVVTATVAITVTNYTVTVSVTVLLLTTVAVVVAALTFADNVYLLNLCLYLEQQMYETTTSI